MKAFLLALVCSTGLSSIACAQNAVTQNGTITVNRPAKWIRDRAIGDAGGLTGDAAGRGMAPTSITDSLGLGLCFNSAVTTGQYNALCLGHDSDGNGKISLESVGGLANKTLIFDINGTEYEFPGTGSGDVVGPATTVVGNAPFWNNTEGTLLGDRGAPGTYTVPTNAALVALTGASGMQVIRTGYTADGDSPQVPYRWSAVNCTAADNGAQVQPSVTGCWIANFDNVRATPKIWGAAADGVTNDATAFQAAITALWTSTSTRPLYILKNEKYLIGTGLTSSNRALLIREEGPPSPYVTACPSGIIVNSDINALTLTGPTATVINVCFQMASAAGDRASGYALKVGGTVGTQNRGQIKGVSVIYPFDGILVGGATTGATQTNGSVVEDNLIISPSNEGIAIGRESSEASTVGLAMRNNQVVCFEENAAATGIAHYDGAVRYEGGDVGPYLCNVGVAIKPGTVGGNRQLALGQYSGVLGDSSLSVGLDIDATAATASAFYLKFVNAWSAGTTATSRQVRVRNTGSGTVKNLSFVGSIFHSGEDQSVPIMDLTAGENITISGNQFAADGGGTTTGAAIDVTSGVDLMTINGNTFGGFNGTLALGIELPSPGGGNGLWTITGNTINATAPISYTPSGETAVIRNNVGVDNDCAAIADAAGISFPNAATCAVLAGATTITGISNSAWSNREINIISADGKTINGGGAPLCGADNLTLAAGRAAKIWWYQGGNCWQYAN